MTYATVRANVSPVREHALHVRPMFLIPASYASMWLSAAASSLRRSRRTMRYPRSIPFASKLKPARLMCYGADNLQMYRHVRCDTPVLKGAKPADLPVMQSTKSEFVVNLQTDIARPTTWRGRRQWHEPVPRT